MRDSVRCRRRLHLHLYLVRDHDHDPDSDHDRHDRLLDDPVQTAHPAFGCDYWGLMTPRGACYPRTRASRASSPSFLAEEKKNRKCKVWGSNMTTGRTHIPIQHNPKPFDLFVHPALGSRNNVSHTCSLWGEFTFDAPVCARSAARSLLLRVAASRSYTFGFAIYASSRIV